MRLTLFALLMSALPSAAFAQAAPTAPPSAPTYPMVLQPNDLGNIRQICTSAMDKDGIPLEQKTAVGEYCQDFLARLSKALATKSEPQKADGQK